MKTFATNEFCPIDFSIQILGIAHKWFYNYKFYGFFKDTNSGAVYDVKGVVDREQIDGRL